MGTLNEAQLLSGILYPMILEEIPIKKSVVTLTFPPHSFTQITVGLER